MALTCSIGPSGIAAPTYPEVLAELQTRFRAIYGQDVYLEADSQDGQLLAVFARAIHDCNQTAVAVYNSFSPATAVGEGLSRNARINGLVRQLATFSVVNLLIVGQAGTVINNGIARDSAGQRWLLPSVVTIPGAGQISVQATAELIGAVRAAPNTITEIATPTRGWQTVTNPLSATTGRASETDAELRRRQARSTALPASTVLSGVVAAVASVPGVSRVQGYENATNAIDSRGLPARSIALVVDGGSLAAVAAAIALKKPPGIITHGSTSVQTFDAVGAPAVIKFFPLTLVTVKVQINIAALPGYQAATGTQLVQAVADFISGLAIGQPVYQGWLFGPANLNWQGRGLSFNVTSITIARASDALSTSNIDLAFNEAAVCVPADVTLVVS